MKLKGKFVKFIENNRKYYGFQVVGNIDTTLLKLGILKI